MACCSKWWWLVTQPSGWTRHRQIQDPNRPRHPDRSPTLLAARSPESGPWRNSVSWWCSNYCSREESMFLHSLWHIEWSNRWSGVWTFLQEYPCDFIFEFLPMENSPPAIHTMPAGALRGAAAGLEIAGRNSCRRRRCCPPHPGRSYVPRKGCGWKTRTTRRSPPRRPRRR